MTIVVAASLAILRGQGSDGPLPRGADADIGDLTIDGAWARGLGARPRDVSGLVGAGGTSVTWAEGALERPGTHASRRFGTGFPGLEPTLGVTRNGWIFYQAFTADAKGLVLRSTDSGATWRPVSTPRASQDPYLWVDPATDRIFTTDFTACGSLSFSDDYGESWTEALPVGCGYHTDHQTLAGGPPVTSQTTYPNVLYYCSIGGGAFLNSSTAVVCSKSLDGGLTFTPTATMPFPPLAASTEPQPEVCANGSGHIFVAADGALYVPRGVCGQPWLAISRDEGATWTRVQVADNGMGYGAIWDHEAAVRADGKGNVFYAWVARDRIPYLAISRDGGTTWAPPVRVAPRDVREAVLPNMDMDPSGRLALVYMGSTNSPGAPFPNDGVCTYEYLATHPAAEAALYCYQTGDLPYPHPAYAGVTWNAYVTLIADPLKPKLAFETAALNAADDPLIRGECGPTRCQAEYDFLDVAFRPRGEIAAAVIDACDPQAGCTANGEAVLGIVAPAGYDFPGNYVADGALALALTPRPERTTGATSPEGCELEPGPALGLLAPALPPGPCHSALHGWLEYNVDLPAEFESAPLATATLFGGDARVVAHIADSLREAGNAASAGRFEYELAAVDPDGRAFVLSAGETLQGLADGRNEGTFPIRLVEVPAGNRLRLRFRYPGATSSSARLLFGGAAYGDAGIALPFGHLDANGAANSRAAPAQTADAPESAAAGAPSASLLGWLFGLAALRRGRRPRLACKNPR